MVSKPPVPLKDVCRNGHKRTEENTQARWSDAGRPIITCLDCKAISSIRARPRRKERHQAAMRSGQTVSALNKKVLQLEALIPGHGDLVERTREAMAELRSLRLYRSSPRVMVDSHD